MSEPIIGRPDVTESLRVPWDDDPEDLYEHAPCGYLSALPDGTIVKVNQTFLGWTGFQRIDLVGKRRLRDLLTVGGRFFYETHYAPLLSMQGKVHEIAFDIVCADGRRLPTLVNSVLSRDAQGNPRVVRTTVFDSTDRRRYERELLAARRLAEASESRVRVLQQIVADLAAAPTEAGVAAAVTRAPGAAFGATHSLTWLVDTHRAQLVPVGPDADGSPEIPLGSPRPEAEVVRTGELLVLGGAAAEAPPQQEPGVGMPDKGDDTVLLLPLTSATEAGGPSAVLGVLAFGFTGARVLTAGELDVVRLLGNQAGQALHRSRLYDDAKRREARADFFAATTRALDETPRLLSRAERLLARMVPEVAEWAAVDLLVGATGLQAVAGSPLPDVERLAARIASVVAAGEPSFRDDDGPDPGVAVLPLTAGRQVLGTLALRLPAGRRAAAGEEAFLRDLADRAGLAMENARLYEQERAIAQTLQRSLLASDLPADTRFAVDTFYQPATADLEVGGDWFDAFLITGDKLAVVVGDVVGRGIEAATTMGQLRSAIRALSSAEAGPAGLLERLDTFVERVDSARMATVVYAEITLSTGELRYSCAGHLPPLLQEPGAPAQFLWGGRSAPLGSRAGRNARLEERLRLPAGSRLLLYTDGLVERRDRPLDKGLRVLAREFDGRRGAPLPAMTAVLAEDLVGPEHRDDVCLLCVATGVEQRLERRIPADPMQIALLRQDLRSWLASHSVDEETRQAVLLATSEAAANAIEHGYRGDPYGVVTVVATMSPEIIEVQVRDEGSWQPAATNPGRGRGRGMRLIDQAMDEVTVEHEGGTTVTMRRSRNEPGDG